MLFAIGILYIVGALATALTSNLLVFDIFRFLGGIGVGAASVCAPIYTAEISPPAVRGRLVGLVQFNIVLGILLAYLSNFIILQVTGHSDNAWRWMFGVMAVPAAVFLLLLFTVPETPRYLLSVGRDAEGEEVARRLATTDEEADVVISEIHAALNAAENAPNVPFFTKSTPQGDPARSRHRHVQPTVRDQRGAVLRTRGDEAGRCGR